MSLDFSVEAVANHAVVTTDPFNSNEWHPVTRAIVWLSMAVDLGSITEKNLDEFSERAFLWQKLHGASLMEDDNGKAKPLYITKEDLRLHIGLRTNVADRTRAEFNKKLLRSFKVEAEQVERHQIYSAYERYNSQIITNK
jgi:hypothetical protein